MTNILLLTADQWRGDCLSVLGHPHVRTPALDALAEEAVLFRRHYAGAAPCSPARACLYTGLYQMNNRVCRNGTPLDARHDNIALAARRAGYQPTLFGYTDQSPDPRGRPPRDPALTTYEGILPGFTVRQRLDEAERPYVSWLAARGVDVSAGHPGIHTPAGMAADPPTTAPPVYSADETQTAFMAGEFLRWLGEQERGEPWFAHLSFLRPHPPFVVPEPYASLVAPDAVAGFLDTDDWREIAARHPFLDYVIGRWPKGSFIPGTSGLVRDWSRRDMQVIAAIYYGMIAEVDIWIGRIVKALKRRGDWDDTILVFTSDHGEMMGDHHMMGKFGFYDQSYQIPLIVRDPLRRAAHGTTVERFTEAVDVFPTIMDLIGERAPAHLDGQPLTEFLEGREPEGWRAAAHFEYDFREIASREAEAWFGLPPQALNLAVLRGERYKYVHFAGLEPLLFDLELDPGETRNVAADPAYLTARIDCAEELLAWRARHLDQSLALTELTAAGPVSL